jgi:pilus assembly protein CpaB
VSLGHVVMVASGLLAFVFVAAALRDRADTVQVLVATADLPAGTQLDGSNTELASLPADSPLAASLLTPDRLADGGLVVGGAVRAGEPLLASAVVAVEASSGLRAMSVPIERSHAVGGALRVGDLVDIADVDADGSAVWAVTGAQVLEVGSESAGLGGVSGSFFVVVDVTADQALRLAAALADGQVHVVRSTGAEPVAVSR